MDFCSIGVNTCPRMISVNTLHITAVLRCALFLPQITKAIATMATRKASRKASDWNVSSKYYRVTSCGNKKSKLSDDDSVLQITYDGDRPSSESDIESFISENGLNHGDLVNFSDYRQSDVYIIQKEMSGKMGWIQNPDDHAAGYMTIPYSILEHVTDAIGKYKHVLQYMTDENQSFNMHLSAKDIFILEKLGQAEEGYDFDLHFEGSDQVEAFYVQKMDGKKGEYKDFEWDSVTWEEIKEAFNECGDAQKVCFNVKVMITGDELNTYQNKHTKEGASKYAWRQATPKLPKGWKLEKGQGMAGSNKAGWVWKLQGPGDSEPDVKQRLAEHFGDVPFHIAAETDSNLKF